MKLYYHKTDGGAEYLMDTFIKWKHNGKSGKEGVMNSKTKYLIRIDGDITKDAELDIREEKLTNKQTNDILKKLKDYGFVIIDTQMGHKEQMDIFNIQTISEEYFNEKINEALEK